MEENPMGSDRHEGFDLSRKPILETVFRCMEEDPSIVIIGEGARLKARLDYPPLLERFSDRIFTGPIAEGGMVNMALGASVTGLRPIVDIIFDDLLLRSMDEILNEAAKIHIMSGGKLKAKMVIKTEFSKYENSQSGSRWDYLFEKEPPPHQFGPSPLKIAVPKTIKESVEMMDAALRYEGPTLYFEDRLMQS
jgi:acetoin:2,6-dichlorophenolindophenol oxidoreductase subunit beta